MKSSLIVMAVAVLLTVMLVHSTRILAGPCGDINADEAVNVSDLTYLVGYLFQGGPAPDCGLEIGTVTDIDGNVYQTVTIGTQVWMMENLKVSHYRNGDSIPNVTDVGIWAGLNTGAYCEYNNEVNNVATYGRLYNWYAVADSRDIAPEGWHVPSDEDWKQLEMYLGMSQAGADAISWRGTDEGGKLKEGSTSHWQSPNIGATNESGFTALPAGYRSYDGTYWDIGLGAFFWTSSEYVPGGSAWYRVLSWESSAINRDHHSKSLGSSVRCVRD